MSAVTKEPGYDLHSSIYLSIRKLSAVRGKECRRKSERKKDKTRKRDMKKEERQEQGRWREVWNERRNY